MRKRDTRVRVRGMGRHSAYFIVLSSLAVIRPPRIVITGFPTSTAGSAVIKSFQFMGQPYDLSRRIARVF